MQSQSYSLSKNLSIPSGQTVYFVGVTALDYTTIFNPLAVYSSVSPITIKLFEGGDITSLGSQTMQGVNMSRLNGDVNKTIVYVNPTIPAEQSKEPIFESQGFGTNQTGSSTQSTCNFVLKRETPYLYAIKNDSNQSAKVSINFTWKEVKG